MSLEGAERRTQLVGQLKFAATLQDLRTVMVLRRQLAMELPRSRALGPAALARPAARLAPRGARRPALAGRPASSASPASASWPASACGAWPTARCPLVLVAGLALYVAGLDAVESMAQEADHPGRSDALPAADR